MSIQIGEPPSKASQGQRGFALFALGFRPFFLASGIAALALLSLWLMLWPGKVSLSHYFPPVLWHAHEMLFGYAMAVIAGFLLTAVRNWTGMAVPTGGKLGLLFIVWLAGRFAISVPGIPAALVAAVDLLFLPLLGYSLLSPLWRGPNLVNRYFLAFFSSMWVANLMFHLEALSLFPGAWQHGEYLMLNTVLLTLLLVAGRVMPFFTEKAVPASSPVRRRWVEQAGFILVTALALADLLWPAGKLAGILALALALVQTVRLAGWYHHGIWRLPVLWVLYTGYAWIVFGLLLRSLAAFDLLPYQLALHALTVGGVGVLTLGMMSRVALGHSGRDINVSWLVAMAFVLLNLGAFVRVILPMLLPERYAMLVNLSGGFWLLAFLLFVIVYMPVLMRPRIDGRPG